MAKVGRRACSYCGEMVEKGHFYTAYGELNTRGRHCIRCAKESLLHDYFRSATINKIRFCKSYGDFWHLSTPPATFATELYNATGGRCTYCDRVLTPDAVSNAPDKPNIDHIEPLSRGGYDSVVNALTCCRHCNLRKGSLRFAEWLTTLSPGRKLKLTAVYEKRFGYKPSDFIDSEMWGVRIDGSYCIDEEALNRLLKPISTERLLEELCGTDEELNLIIWLLEHRVKPQEHLTQFDDLLRESMKYDIFQQDVLELLRANSSKPTTTASFNDGKSRS